MKLFLSSMHPTNKDELRKLVSDVLNPSAVVIPTGWDTYPAERKEAETQKALGLLKGYGFATSTLDIATADKQTVVESLLNKQLVWVMAGNSFYLNYHLHRSGFSEVIREFLDKGIVYGGESAGAVVAGATLRGIEHVDDPKATPETIWNGLGLYDKGILPHWGWQKYDSYLQAAKKDMQETTEVVTLTNDQALVVNDGRERVTENLFVENV